VFRNPATADPGDGDGTVGTAGVSGSTLGKWHVNCTEIRAAVLWFDDVVGQVGLE
jgi:hypothetical protein